jgi:hypothetical protein
MKNFIEGHGLRSASGHGISGSILKLQKIQPQGRRNANTKRIEEE